MDSKITHCLIDDQDLPLLFSLGACEQLNDRLGDVDALLDLFRAEESPEEKAIREEIEQDMPPEERQEREQAKSKLKLEDVLPFVMAVLAREENDQLKARIEALEAKLAGG